MDWYGVGWLILVTVVWLLAAMVAMLMLGAYMMQSTGSELGLHGWRQPAYLTFVVATLFVVPPGLAVAAQVAGFTPWLWLLYMWPYEIIGVWAVYVHGINRWWHRPGTGHRSGR
jgi:hypothetical protein